MQLSLCHGWVPWTINVSLPQAAHGRFVESISTLLMAGRQPPHVSLLSSHSGQIAGSSRPEGVQGDAGEREISLFMAEKFHFLVTYFTNCVIRQNLHV
jgi:hypothetical protein